VRRNYVCEPAPASMADGTPTTCWHVHNSWGSHVATITAIPAEEDSATSYCVTYRRDGAPINYFYAQDYRGPQGAMAAARDSVAYAD
jgi:hypothetical protein